jgi:hypothetical protein
MTIRKSQPREDQGKSGDAIFVVRKVFPLHSRSLDVIETYIRTERQTGIEVALLKYRSVSSFLYSFYDTQLAADFHSRSFSFLQGSSDRFARPCSILRVTFRLQPKSFIGHCLITSLLLLLINIIE